MNPKPLSAKDIFKKLLTDLNPTSGAFTWEMAATTALLLLIALAVGMLIYAVYRKFYRGAVFSQSFAVTLVGMSVLTCAITVAISSNLVISLGMVGALSIVRYRTAIKEPMDLLFLFWAITSGISVGAKLYLLAAATSAVLVLVLFMLSRSRRQQAYVMIVHYEGDAIGDEIRRVLARVRHTVKSRTMRGQSCELAVELSTHRENLSFMQAIRNLPGVADVTLVEYNGEYHG